MKRRVAGRLIASLILLQGLPAPLFAGSFYVSSSGNDAGSGSQADPWRTIQRALNSAYGGDTVEVMAGTYSEKITFPRSGSSDNFITLQGQSGAVLSGQGLTKIGGGEYDPLVRLAGVSYIRIQGMTITNWKSSIRDEFLIGLFIQSNCHHVEISACQVSEIQQTYWNGNKSLSE